MTNCFTTSIDRENVVTKEYSKLEKLIETTKPEIKKDNYQQLIRFIVNWINLIRMHAKINGK